MNFSFLKKVARPFNINSGVELLKSGGYITMSWGIENLTAVENKGTCYGLSFDVNGMKFQGTVLIYVNFLDYYEVRFYDNNGNEVHKIVDIFVGDFISLVDEFVEKQPEYVR